MRQQIDSYEFKYKSPITHTRLAGKSYVPPETFSIELLGKLNFKNMEQSLVLKYSLVPASIG
jgi:hypothetical protein